MVVVINKGESRKSIQNKLLKLRKKERGFPASEFIGKIKIDEDAVKIQRRLRNEWE